MILFAAAFAIEVAQISLPADELKRRWDTCLAQADNDLDDGISDAATIARAAVAGCEIDWERYLIASGRTLDQADDTIARERDMMIDTQLMLVLRNRIRAHAAARHR